MNKNDLHKLTANSPEEMRENVRSVMGGAKQISLDGEMVSEVELLKLIINEKIRSMGYRIGIVERNVEIMQNEGVRNGEWYHQNNDELQMLEGRVMKLIRFRDSL